MNTTPPDWVLYELGIGLDGQPQPAPNQPDTAVPTVEQAFPYPDAWLQELVRGGQSDDDPTG